MEYKVKAQCTHCSKVSKYKEIGYSLNYVACKFCKKEGELKEVK